MLVRRAIFAALTLTALLACESAVEPEVNVDASSTALAVGGGGGRVIESVTGSGHRQRTGLYRTFSLQAQKHEDGTVSGTWQVNTHGGNEARGTVTCFGILGNQAYLGGVFLSASDPSFVGDNVIFAVEDNGEGKNAQAPDRVTSIFPTEATDELIRRYCTGEFGASFTLIDVEKGTIQIRGDDGS